MAHCHGSGGKGGGSRLWREWGTGGDELEETDGGSLDNLGAIEFQSPESSPKELKGNPPQQKKNGPLTVGGGSGPMWPMLSWGWYRKAAF